MKLQYLFTLLLPMVMSGCESLVTDVAPENLPDTQSKLVVQSFISPQAARINVAVTESEPLFGQATTIIEPIKNAVVKITDGISEVTIPYNSDIKLYSIDTEKFPIVAGKTYQLHVSDGKRSVNASCKVPARQAVVKTYAIDTAYTNEIDRDTALTVKMSWQDIPADTNYYRIRAYVDLEYSIPEGTSFETLHEKRISSRFTFRWDNTIGRNDFQSDVNLDGAVFSSAIGKMTLPTTKIFDFGNGKRFAVDPKSKIIAVTFEVENTDAVYFRYHRSLELSDNENPFSEPALIYNNINGGLGCFAAYNTGSLVYKP